nr:hypothetical protein [uncultured Allomuricauda sp.]
MAVPRTYQEFTDTLIASAPMADWPLALQSLWWAAKGDWNSSHDIAQDLHTEMGSWIHAYLHRLEGDEWNAGYWYRQANRSLPEITLEDELRELIAFVLVY